ncbi:fungal-specific transcription factor domain-containing protein [Cubamyces lactineus]|nr:fungal-specific transcription factor domain-containing protein [Cubamyces lactineus]
MALKGLPPSPASGDSNSPSPELPSDGASTNASPLSASTSLYISQASDEGESAGNHSSRGTPTRFMDAARANAAGKGGCWYAYLKCDEEREGNSCKTCLRLHIDCLGWGPKRPDWMRDKEKVAAYKADIKEKLSRMGLIRGQPRQPWHAGSLSTSQPPTPGIAGPGPRTTLRRSASAGDPHNLPSASSSRANQVSPMLGFLPTPTSASMSDSMYGFPQASSSVSISGDDVRYGMLAGQGLPMPVPSTPSIRQDEYIAYYFKHVRELQFVFAGDSLTSILYPLVQAEPNGAVAYSLCALAALHHARVRMARGADPIAEDPDNENAPSRQFYDRALYRLMHAPQTNGTGQYSDSDAIAAVQLVSYAVLGGGTMDWTSPLEFACEWLAQTGIYNEENPKLTLLGMSATGRFAAKATMYIDVLSSITLKQPPRFLPLYKRLFGGGGGFWASNSASPRASAQQAELRMDALTGCPDEALLALAEISALAHWKASELQSGSLSVRELIRRGDIIEKELRERATGVSMRAGDDEYQSQAALAGLEMGVTPAGLPMAMGMQPGMSGASRSPRAPVDTTKHVIAEMFRESAVLYLHTILSDSSPGVPEIINSVDQLMKLLNELPPSAYDRALVFPLFLLGAMSNNQMMREVVKHRFFMQDATMGNILLAQTVMEQVWVQRENVLRATRPGGRPASFGDWRDNLRMEWASLLLM